MATAATIRSLSTGSLARHESAHVVHAAGVEHVARLNPAAARGADAETHLPREPLGAMAVAVDGDRDARGGRLARDRAIHVEVPRRTVDFHRGAGLGRRREQRVESMSNPSDRAGERLAGCVMTLTSGWRMALRYRRVSWAPMWSAESCSDASTMSNPASTSSSKSSVPSRMMS